MLVELSVSYSNHNLRTAGGITRNQQTFEEMERLGGQEPIPLLVDHQYSVELYTSDDIINRTA